MAPKRRRPPSIHSTWCGGLVKERMQSPGAFSGRRERNWHKIWNTVRTWPSPSLGQRCRLVLHCICRKLLKAQCLQRSKAGVFEHYRGLGVRKAMDEPILPILPAFASVFGPYPRQFGDPSPFDSTLAPTKPRGEREWQKRHEEIVIAPQKGCRVVQAPVGTALLCSSRS